jgi:glycosyltransferase involved in cell wall biosynthesis
MRKDFLISMYGIKQKKITILPFGVDLTSEVLKKQLKAKQEATRRISAPIRVVCGGKFDSRKNFPQLVAALKNLKRRFDLEIRIFGSLADDDKHQLDSSLPEAKFLGWLHKDEVTEVLIWADVAIYPGTHSTLWEQTLGCGTPAIFHYWPGMEFLNIDGNCEFIYTSKTTEIVQTCTKAFTHENLSRMKSQAMKVMSSFDYYNIACTALEVN